MSNTLHSRRNRFISLVAVAAMSLSLFVAASGGTGGVSQARADTAIAGVIPIEVTRIDGAVPLIIGGTVIILNEEAVSTAPVTTFDFIDGFESLDMHFRQSSVEQFTSTDFATARAISGEANGTMTATSSATGATVATGSYKLSMSNTPECQMKGNGTWSLSSDKFDVSGTVSTCVNWDPSIENFTGIVSVEGNLEMKAEQEVESGPVRRLLRGLFGR